jgi:hypothetical protein
VTGRGPSGSVRARPYPYRALLALCSDLDETPDRQVYGETARFLNTTAATTMGPGVGLEVGNSLYFDMPDDQFAYWNTDEQGREMLRALIRSGHLDCLHSYGDLAVSRVHAGRALDELARHGCAISVWVDHSVAPTNFGADIMRGEGDLPASPAYHADLTCSYGVRYVWRGRVTSVIGQDVPRRLRGIFEPRHPLASLRTLAKEGAKGALARAGRAKYAMHAPNRALREVRLRDGRRAWEFLRSNPYWGAVDGSDTASGLASVLTPGMLQRLTEREGTCILYTHLGKVRDRAEPLPRSTRLALAGLAERQRRGEVLVTTTRRLLDYCRLIDSLDRPGAVASPSPNGAGPDTGPVWIDLPAPEPAASLDGLTLYVADPDRTRLRVGGREVTGLVRNPPDHTGRPSVSVPWPRLEFPDV